MKKLSYLLSLFVLLTAFTCEDEPIDEDISPVASNSCEAAVAALFTATSNFSNATEDNFTELCNAMRAALEAQIEACGDPNGSIQETINSLNCDLDTIDTCEEATSIVALAEIAYNGATEDNYTQLCNDYKTALFVQQTACGDEDGSIQTVIDSLGDCQ